MVRDHDGQALAYVYFEDEQRSSKVMRVIKRTSAGCASISAYDPKRTSAEDRCFVHHPCFAMRLGGVSGGKDTQGWRDSSHTPMVGAGKFGSAKLPIATATYPGKPSPSQ
jgi:hypothetical protein